MSRPRGMALFVIIAALIACGAALGQDMPRLPKDTALPQSAGSPGPVLFSHATHVGMQDKPDCTRCHPKAFSILKPSRPAGGQVVTHASMEKGRQCGSCHNGKAAFGFDDCSSCHRR